MRSTCRPISSPASATGRSRSAPTRRRRGPQKPATKRMTSCMRWTTSSTPTCRWGRMAKRRRWSRRCAASAASPRRSSPVPMRWARGRRATRASAGRGARGAAAALAVRPSPLAHVEAMTHFARAMGAARSGKPDDAKAEIAKLAELRDKLRAAKDAYWAEQVDIQSQLANAWVLYAEGKYDDALKAMSAAADAEDKTEKHPVTPGVPTPARELYGTMLLERGLAKEALAAFEATLNKEPHRLCAAPGTGAAAESRGCDDTA